MPYTLEFREEALDDWKKLDHSVKLVFASKLEQRLANPFVPSARLSGDLVDHYRIKSDRTGHRLVYIVIGQRLVVTAVGKRAGKVAYKTALKRRL